MLLLCSVYYRHISSVPLISLLALFKAAMWGLALLGAPRLNSSTASGKELPFETLDLDDKPRC